MKKNLLFILMSFIGLIALPQHIKVLDITNLQPIYNVAIFNLQQSKTALTNNSGVADISAFNSNDTLFFQHPSYQEIILPYQSLAAVNYVINLTRSTVNLSEVVVSASKWEQKREEVPNKITSIEVKEMTYLNSQTTADLLGNTNEIFIQKSQLGGGSPMIRGFSANSVLLVVDGVRMNNAIYRSGNLQNVISLDPNIIENAEIIFGPGSIIYGSDALGGVMDFHTQEVLYAQDKNNLVKGNALFRFSTANTERTGHFDIAFGRKKWGFVTSATFGNFGDLKMGSLNNDEYQRYHYQERIGDQDSMLTNTDPNIQKFSGYNQVNFMQKIGFKVSESLELNYGFHYSTTSDLPRYDRLIQYDDENFKYGDWYYGPQEWMMHNFSAVLNKNTLLFNNASFTFAYQNSEESRHSRKFSNNIKSSRTENVDMFNLNFDLDKKLSEKNTLFYGLEGTFNNVQSSAFASDIMSGEKFPESTRYPDGGSDYYTAALYANFKSNLNTKLTLQAGLRYSYVYSLSNFTEESKNFYPFSYDEIELTTGALNGSLGLVYRPSGTWQMNMNLSSGFRAPNIDDIAKVFDSEPGNVVVPNPDLKPEYVYNVDVGVSKKIGNKVRIEATAFYTIINDLMDRRDFQLEGQDSIIYDGEMSNVQAIQNVTNGWIAGVSFTFLADLTEHIGFKSTANYMQGKDNDNLPIRHVSPFFGSTGFTYSAKKIKLDLYAVYNGRISNDNLAESEQGKTFMYATDDNGNPYSPGWYTLNLKGYYQITNYLQINLGLENILNQRYRPYSSGIVAPGRNFIIALRANF